VIETRWTLPKSYALVARITPPPTSLA